MPMIKVNLALFALAVLLACGTAKSSSRRADTVPAPLAGYTCFVILEDDRAVGGNCLKN